jgi:Holliday junction DNA helicase RuvA
MISFLHGKLAQATPTRITVDVGGVGYDVLIPLSSYDKLPPPGHDVRVLIYHHFIERQGTQQLFGFLTEAEREMFKLLLNVNGIGPKSALNILSGIARDTFQRAVASGDVKLLSNIPGIGKKTAERIVVELKDKVGATDAASAAPSGRALTPEEQVVNDAILALVSLGYKQADAQKAATKARETLGAKANVEELVRRALQGG